MRGVSTTQTSRQDTLSAIMTDKNHLLFDVVENMVFITDYEQFNTLCKTKAEYLNKCMENFHIFINDMVYYYFNNYPKRTRGDLMELNDILSFLERSGYTIGDAKYATHIGSRQDSDEYEITPTDYISYCIVDKPPFGNRRWHRTELKAEPYSYVDISYWKCEEVYEFMQTVRRKRNEEWRPQFYAYCHAACDFWAETRETLENVYKFVDDNFKSSKYNVKIEYRFNFEHVLMVSKNDSYFPLNMCFTNHNYKDRLETFRTICETFTKEDNPKSLPPWMAIGTNLRKIFEHERLARPMFWEAKPEYFQKEFDKDC